MVSFKMFIGCLFLSITFSLSAQKISLINSGEVINEGKQLYDSSKYGEAIKKYQTVHPKDTNYVFMLSELALAYIANKDHDLAIQTCEKALLKPSEHRSHLLKSLAIAHDRKGEYEKSVKLFEKAIQEFPFDFSLYYNLAITFYNHKDYDKATSYFIKTLWLNPFHGGSHVNLGKLSMLQGKKVKAMMCFGVYLGINNKDNGSLLMLERFVNNEITDEGTLQSDEVNPFEKLDQVIKAKIALDNNFKSSVPVNASVVKQFQLLLDQLSTIESAPNDFWCQFYLPFYKGLKERNLFEPFIYHMLSSTKIEQVAKWKNKNEKKLKEFYTYANTILISHRENKVLPDEFGFKNPVQCWYNEANHLEAIGHESNNVRSGKWKFYSNNGVCVSEGSYNDQGKKIGTWTFYFNNGITKRKENHTTGEMVVFNEQGILRHKYLLKDDKIQGDVEIYYPCGILKEKLAYTEGKRNGPGQTFYLNGNVETLYNHKDDLLNGAYVIHYEDGKIKTKIMYANDEYHGDYYEYYPSGRVKIRGAYDNGKAEGNWKYYFSNGRLEKTGDFKEDLLAGEWLFYNERGNLIEKRKYNDKGEIHGTLPVFHNGKLYYDNTYKDGILIAVTYYDVNGKELGKFANNNGTFSVKGYYPTGELEYEGAFQKGKSQGEWKYYYRTGALKSKSTYVQDKLQGIYIEYFKSGGIKYEMMYKDDELHGYYKAYFPHEQVKEEGWYQGGLREQTWLTYYTDGTVESEYYYLRGDQLENKDFNTDEKMYYKIEFDENRITGIFYYNENGEIIFGKELSGKKEVLEQKFANGKIHSHLELTCGEFSNDIIRGLPNGKIIYNNPIQHGRRHGHYQYFYLTGQVEVEGDYSYGNEVGRWTWYHNNGKKYNDGFYLDGERDSIWMYYHDNGKVSDEIEYKAGKRNGLTKIYSTEGILIVEKVFDKGDPIAYRTLSADGNMSEWKKFTSNAIITAYFSNGKKAYEEEFKNGVPDGIFNQYYITGNAYTQHNNKRGDYTGDYKVYYPSGKLKEKGQYKFDELDGKIEHFYEDGTLQYVENYSLGIRNGKAIVYSKNSNPVELVFWAGLIVK